MPECWICGRATVMDDWLPLNICRRASCEPEREYLLNRFKRELAHDYFRIESWGRDSVGGEA